MNVELLRKKQHRNLIFSIVFLAVSGFLIWKCRYGFAYRDEGFYLITPLRLYQGDSLFSQEWHLSQMSAVLLLPFVSGYMKLFQGNTEGIFLFFRYLCTVLQIIAALFTYVRLRNYSWPGAFTAAIAGMIYTPFGIMALSYNSMGILCLSISVILFFTAKVHKKIDLFLAGVFLSGAVLCCPYLAVLYIFYTLLVTVIKILEKRIDTSHVICKEDLNLANWLVYSCGILFSLISFLLFVFSRTSISKIAEAIPYILNDPEHKMKTVSGLVYSFYNGLKRCGGKWSANVWFLFLVLFVFEIKDIRKKYKAFYFLLSLVLTIALFVPFLTEKSYLNLLMLPLNALGLNCLFLSQQVSIKRAMLLLWIPGFVYSFCLNATSNQSYYAVSSALSVSLIGSSVMFFLLVKELCQEYRNKIFLGFLVFISWFMGLFQIGSELVFRYQSIFWDTTMEEQNTLFEEGPHKGLYCREVMVNYFSKYIRTIKNDIAYQEADSVLFLSMNTWLYLIGDKKISSYSGWMSGINNDSIERTIAYFEMNEDKIPDMIYADHDYREYAQILSDRYDYEWKEIASGVILTQIAPEKKETSDYE